MKKTIYVLSMLLMMTFTAFAGNRNISTESSSSISDTEMKVLVKGDIVKVFYQTEQVGNLTVEVIDEDGNKIHSELIRNRDSFIRPYNFSNLPNGNYSIIVANDIESDSRTVIFSKKDRPEKEILANISKLKGEDGRYLLTVKDNGIKSINITVTGDESGVVFEEVEKINGDFAKIYKIKSLLPNEKFEFKVNGKVIY